MTMVSGSAIVTHERGQALARADRRGADSQRDEERRHRQRRQDREEKARRHRTASAAAASRATASRSAGVPQIQSRSGTVTKERPAMVSASAGWSRIASDREAPG